MRFCVKLKKGTKTKKILKEKTLIIQLKLDLNQKQFNFKSNPKRKQNDLK